MIFNNTLSKEQYLNKFNIALFLLISTYLMGLFGIGFQIHPDFIRLTPLSLLLSLGIILYNYAGSRKKLLIYLTATFFWGYGMEVMGVQTGFPFGDYRYGEVFGWKLFDTPLLIGVNWFLVSYGTGVLLSYLIPEGDKIIKAIAGAYFMVILDIIIEPIAIRYDFWSWALGHPPVENYIGWFFVGLPPMILFFYLWPKHKDPVGLTFIIMQYIFFLGLSMFDH